MTESALGWSGWFDGTAKPNPGPMGIGVVLLGPEGQHVTRARRLPGQGCNNRAEMAALCALLETARGEGVRQLTVFGDSDIVLRLAGSQGAASAPPVRVPAAWAGEVATLHARLAEFERVICRWVPRHRNQDADRLARDSLVNMEKIEHRK